MISTISYLTTVKLGFGAIALVPEEMKRLNIARPLVVTDRGLVANKLVDRLLKLLPPDVAVFDGTPANPTEAATEAAAALFRARACDGLIAFGGGSSMDLAKAAGILATHPGPLEPYAAANGGVDRIKSNVAPVIAVPTTAGTGSEVGRGAVIILKNGRKLGLVSPYLFPKVAICDPELTFDLPPHLTAATGMDAVAHCVETFCAPSVNPPAEAIALDGLSRAAKHLERAVANGLDREARWEMMVAASEGAMAFQKGLGAVHSLSHPLGALPGRALHHGTLNAILLPYVLRYNEPAIGEAKMARLGQALGLPAGADVVEHMAVWNRRLGIPRGLSELGVVRSEFETVAQQAMKDHCHPTNPRPLDVPDYVALLEQAY